MQEPGKILRRRMSVSGLGNGNANWNGVFDCFGRVYWWRGPGEGSKGFDVGEL